MDIITALDKYIEWRNLKRKSRTVNGDISHLTHFFIFLRNLEMSVEDISLNDCMGWLGILRKLWFDDNTVIKKAIAIKKFFEFLEDCNFNVVNPRLIPVPRKVYRFPRVAEEQEYKKILSVIPDDSYAHIRNRAIIMMLWDTGARNGEILSLNLEYIDTERMAAKIHTEKSRGVIPFREIFWKQETNEALKRWLTERAKLEKKIELKDPDAVFIGIKGGHVNCPGKGRRLQVNFASEILRKYSNKAGLEIPLNPHSCRHHFGRELAQKEKNAFIISSLMGHARVESSYPYTMLFGKDREKLYRETMGD